MVDITSGWWVLPHLCLDNTFRFSYVTSILDIIINGHTCGQNLPNGSFVFHYPSKQSFAKATLTYFIYAWYLSKRNRIHKWHFLHLRVDLRVRLAIQRKSVRKFNLRLLVYIYQISVGQPPPLTLGQPLRQIHRQNPRLSLIFHHFASSILRAVCVKNAFSNCHNRRSRKRRLINFPVNS